MSDEPLDFQAEERRALHRIALSPDGHLLHRYLRRTLESVIDIADAGTLQAHNGRRSFVRDLMREMAQGIEESRRGGRSDQQQQPVLGGPSRPAVIGQQRRSIRERLLANDPELQQLAADAAAGKS